MNEPEMRLNRLAPAELPPEVAASRATARTEHPSEPVAIFAIVIFWILQFAYFSLDKMFRGEVEDWSRLGARAVVSTFGALISFGILKILQRTTGVSLVKRAIIALALACAGSAIHSLINWAIFLGVNGPIEGGRFSLASEAAGYPSLFYLFSWVYLAITVILLSLSYGEELILRERRIVELSRDADRARLSALRYQLNPHFLFNSLNSAASLVSAKRNADAELMLENLADFLRATLKLDAESEISLRDELALQSLYLDVELVRFPNRLRVETDVPKDLLDVLVPNLITQPLIENSIKHSVAQSTEPVLLTIAAREIGGKLEIRISDVGCNAPSESRGTGVGLDNVERRLELHFGAEARFEAGAAADGGFEAVMTMPIRRKP